MTNPLTNKIFHAIDRAEHLVLENLDLLAQEPDRKYYSSALRNIATRLNETADLADQTKR